MPALKKEFMSRVWYYVHPGITCPCPLLCVKLPELILLIPVLKVAGFKSLFNVLLPWGREI